MTDDLTTLDTLINTHRRIEAGGEQLDITPIRVRELPAFLRAVQPIARDAAAGSDLMQLLASHSDAVIEAVSVGIRKPRAWVDALAVDDLVALASAVLEVNADFFVQRVLPAATLASERMSAALTGPNSIPDSGAQG